MLSLFDEDLFMADYSLGGLMLDGPYLLAPLAGVTDSVMRELCREQGAALTYTEMVSAKGLYYGDRNTPKLLHLEAGAGPTAVQIFGSDADVMAYAAEKLSDTEFALIDINMGCPVPKVVKNGEGAALMRDPELAYRVVRAAVQGGNKPVTVKMRRGFDEEHVNAVEVALACEAAGASAVCVHGRTREQYYSGRADWNIIKRVKEAVKICVIGNGDVTDAESGAAIREQTGCDLVMVARAALGNPWIFRDLMRAEKGKPPLGRPSREELSEMMLRHFDGLCRLKGEYSAVREMRKQLAWYTKGLKGAAGLRRLANDIDDARDMRGVLRLED